MDKVPDYVSLVFILTTVATFGFICSGVIQARQTKSMLVPSITGIALIAWLVLQAGLAKQGFFFNFDARPPRLFFAIAPPLVGILYLIFNGRTRKFLLNMPITCLTYLHIVRVPVEMVLWWLYLGGLVPSLMTFEGINYDILSGVTAPFIAIFAVGFKHKRRIIAIIWNFIALGLLVNIVGHAILSAPGPFQKLAFDMPNTGVFYFPYIWLPAFVVPAVLFAHLVSLIKLFEGENSLK